MWHWTYVFWGLAVLVLLTALTMGAGIPYHNYKVRRASDNSFRDEGFQDLLPLLIAFASSTTRIEVRQDWKN
jgi:hypothetical protein